MQLYLRVLAAITCIAGFNAPSSLAYILDLPPVGTNIRYDFVPGLNIFEITDGAPFTEAISAGLTFTQGKHLRSVKDPNVLSDYLVGIHLNFHAPGIRDVFDLQHFSFDEALSLLKHDGSPGTTAINSAVGYYPDRDDEFTFAWDFHVGDEASMYGLEWNITPDLAPGMQLTGAVAITVYFWGAQQVLVAPEPSTLIMFGCALVGMLIFWRTK